MLICNHKNLQNSETEKGEQAAQKNFFVDYFLLTELLIIYKRNKLISNNIFKNMKQNKGLPVVYC